MNVYFISILIRMGEYEKHVKGFWEAESEDDASYRALCDETHNEPLTREEYDSGDEWWDDWMIYQVDGCHLLSDEHAAHVRAVNEWPMNIMSEAD